MSWPTIQYGNIVGGLVRKSTRALLLVVVRSGFNILNSLNFPNTAMLFVGLEPWEERKSPGCGCARC